MGFYIQDFVKNTTMKNSSWLTVNACVIRSIVNEDRNNDVFMPQ